MILLDISKFKKDRRYRQILQRYQSFANVLHSPHTQSTNTFAGECKPSDEPTKIGAALCPKKRVWMKFIQLSQLSYSFLQSRTIRLRFVRPWAPRRCLRQRISGRDGSACVSRFRYAPSSFYVPKCGRKAGRNELEGCLRFRGKTLVRVATYSGFASLIRWPQGRSEIRLAAREHMDALLDERWLAYC